MDQFFFRWNKYLDRIFSYKLYPQTNNYGKIFQWRLEPKNMRQFWYPFQTIRAGGDNLDKIVR